METLGNITLYNADCMIGMNMIKDKSVDAIITDPPYGINFSKGYKKNSGKICGDDGFSVMFFLDEVLKQFHRVLKDDSVVCVFTRFDTLPYWWIRMKNYFSMKNVLVWDKGGIGMGDLKGNWGNSYENILFGTKGEVILNGKREGNVLSFKRSRNEFHETQKPVDLLEHLINVVTNENAVVLDPYAGSCSTAIACMNTNRRFIGFEIDKGYYDIAVKRIEETLI